MPTKIEITYIKNNKNKFDFTVKQNDVVFYTKVYSPKTAEDQHFMGYALAQTAQNDVNKEIERNSNFRWNSFEEFKAWIGSPELRHRAVQYFYDNIEEWHKNPAQGW